MQPKGAQFEFTTKIWQHEGPGGWYFVSLPSGMSTEIRAALRSEEEGWGRLKATARIGSSEWKTAIWFDTKHQTYLLPLKADIRKKENLSRDQELDVTVWV